MKPVMKEGPTIRNIPSQTEQVCNGCKFLNDTAGMRGHKSVTNTFSCTHPDVPNPKDHFLNIKGQIIHYNIEGRCTTPSWCPFLKPKS